MRLFISSVGCVSWLGLGFAPLAAALRSGVFPPFAQEELRPGESLAVGRVGALRDPESAATYKRWGQIDTYSRYGYVAARLALQDVGLQEGERLERYGVFLGTAFGCMEENQRFERYEIRDGQLRGASPLVFKGTVDNAPAGWIAVAFGVRGPNATFVSGDGAGAEAIWAAARQLQRGRAPGILCGGVERLIDLHFALRERDPLRQGEIPSEGAGVLLLETEEALRDRGSSPASALAELVGVVRHRGTIADGLQSAGVRLGLRLDDVGLLALSVPDEQARAREEASFARSAADGGHGAAVEGLEVVADKIALGELHGAWGGIAVAAALARRGVDGAGWHGRRHAVVQVFGEGDESFYLALKEPEDSE